MQWAKYGEVSEWPMVQSWKDCVGAIPPGVRIPSSPFLNNIWSFMLREFSRDNQRLSGSTSHET